MIGPAARLSEVKGAHGRRIELAVHDSYPPTMSTVRGLFERMSPRRRGPAGRRAVGVRMAMKFAAGMKVGLRRED